MSDDNQVRPTNTLNNSRLSRPLRPTRGRGRGIVIENHIHQPSPIDSRIQENATRQVELALQFELPDYITLPDVNKSLDSVTALETSYVTMDFASMFRSFLRLVRLSKDYFREHDWKFGSVNNCLAYHVDILINRLYFVGVETSQIVNLYPTLKDSNFEGLATIVQIIEEIGSVDRNSLGFRAFPLVTEHLIRNLAWYSTALRDQPDDDHLAETRFKDIELDVLYGADFFCCRLLGMYGSVRKLSLMNPETMKSRLVLHMRVLQLVDTAANGINWGNVLNGVDDRTTIPALLTSLIEQWPDELLPDVKALAVNIPDRFRTLVDDAPIISLTTFTRSLVERSDYVERSINALRRVLLVRRSKRLVPGRYSILCAPSFYDTGVLVSSSEAPAHPSDYTMAAIAGWSNCALCKIQGGFRFLNMSNPEREVRTHRSLVMHTTRAELLRLYIQKAMVNLIN